MRRDCAPESAVRCPAWESSDLDNSHATRPRQCLIRTHAASLLRDEGLESARPRIFFRSCPERTGPDRSGQERTGAYLSCWFHYILPVDSRILRGFPAHLRRRAEA